MISKIVDLFNNNQLDGFLLAIAGDGYIVNAVSCQHAFVLILRMFFGGGVLVYNAASGVYYTYIDDVLVGLGDTGGVVASGGVW